MPWWVSANRTWREPSGSSITSWARSTSPLVRPVAAAWAMAAVRAASATAASEVPVDDTA